MKFLAVLAILLAAAEGCQLPEKLAGYQWDSRLLGWNDLNVDNTTIHSIPTDSSPHDFSCFLSNGTTYLLRSPMLKVGQLYEYRYYTCLDIVPAGNNPDLVFFRIRTEDNPTHANKSFQTYLTDTNVTMEQVCNRSATDVPVNFTFFLKEGYEANLGNETCPRSLQAVFSANFTDDHNHEQQCPDGFEINGCDRSHLNFNFTKCDSGSAYYTCLTSLEKDDITYTIISMQKEADSSQNNQYQFACLAQQNSGEEGTLMITKSAGMCGGVPSVEMTANETLSCRSQTPTTPTSGPGSTGNSTETSTPSTQGPGTGGGGEQGGGGAGDGHSCHAASWGVLSLLFPAFIAVLAAVNP